MSFFFRRISVGLFYVLDDNGERVQVALSLDTYVRKAIRYIVSIRSIHGDIVGDLMKPCTIDLSPVEFENQ